MNPLVLLALAGVGLFALSKKKDAALLSNTSFVPVAQPAQLPAASTTTSVSTLKSQPVTPKAFIPESVTQAISKAIGSLDPQVIASTADQLDKQGFNQQAADLRAFSKGMMNAMNKA
jgi:hypothetical protein